ncbi:MAG: DNA mismatch repair protein MutS [Deltaproteobacteria bacterium]|nr:DNA mismatch repair protein MutS [Deltaproteobacteria bacterium]
MKHPPVTPAEPPDQARNGDSPFPDPVVLPLEDVLDLHPFAPKDIRSVVEEYLTQCREAGFSSVRLIHGKGRGVQRASIRALLARLPFVTGWDEAPPEAGGWGATIVSLSVERTKPAL